MFLRPLLTTTISETLPLGPDEAAAAFDVHRFEGVVAGLWAAHAPGIRLTFIGIPVRRPYLVGYDVLTVAVRVAMGAREIVGEIELVPYSRRATEVRLGLGDDASRRAARWFDGHVDELRPIVAALTGAIADAATRVTGEHDLFEDGLFQTA